MVRVEVVWVSVLASTTKRALEAADIRLGLKTRVPFLVRWVCAFNTFPEIPRLGAFPLRDKQVQKKSQVNCAHTPPGLPNRLLAAASKDLFLRER